MPYLTRILVCAAMILSMSCRGCVEYKRERDCVTGCALLEVEYRGVCYDRCMKGVR